MGNWIVGVMDYWICGWIGERECTGILRSILLDLMKHFYFTRIHLLLIINISLTSDKLSIN